MRIVFVRSYKSITRSVADIDLADFIVLSGPNGSGKSHLLEAIEGGHMTVDGTPPGNAHIVRRLVSSQLLTPSAGPQSSSAYRNGWANFEGQVEDTKRTILQDHPDLAEYPDALEAELESRLVGGRKLLTQAGLNEMTTQAKKGLLDFEHNDFRSYAPLLTGLRDPFQLSISELFLAYHNRLIANELQQWRYEKGRADNKAYTDSEFERQFGARPWIVLDEILLSVGLDYRFTSPENTEEDQQYEVRLRHNLTGVEIPIEHLSPGEKTLLTIAMSLYIDSRSEEIQLPHVLLLDEADSTLHPSMVTGLLRVMREIFVAKHGVKVILTTHSPTTVALAPEESLYVMRRSPDPRLRQAANRDEALASLTVGLSILSVRIDNRRTVFVESEYDENCYQELFRLLRPQFATELSLDFIASGKGGQGNSAAVRYLVKQLRDAGNTTIWGIVDRDEREDAPSGIVFNRERYAIENMVFDPLILGAFLLREMQITSAELGLSNDLRHIDLTGNHAQAIIDSISSRVFPDRSDTNVVEVKYLGGFAVEMPDIWLNHKGHDLEHLVRATYPKLKGFGKNLKHAVISKAYGDLPNFLPCSTMNMLAEILQ
jgi:energy-coupling factor transporter ATP-binding protein EcfA2